MTETNKEADKTKHKGKYKTNKGTDKIETNK